MGMMLTDVNRQGLKNNPFQASAHPLSPFGKTGIPVHESIKYGAK
jgi:hypothetical protein